MMLCRVDGNLTATVKHKSANGWRLILCQPIGADGMESGPLTVAIDPLGAGLHSRVLVSTDGKHTSDLVNDRHTPLRNCIVALVDDLEICDSAKLSAK